MMKKYKKIMENKVNKIFNRIKKVIHLQKKKKMVVFPINHKKNTKNLLQLNMILLQFKKVQKMKKKKAIKIFNNYKKIKKMKIIFIYIENINKYLKKNLEIMEKKCH